MEESTELEIRDFGPIVKARIDLRPLTVFVGPSNTGKSYLAILIYALHRHFSNLEFFSHRLFRHTIFNKRNQRIPDLSLEELKSILNKTLPYNKKQIKGETSSIALPSQLSKLIQCRFEETANDFSDEIKRCFGLSNIASLTRKGGKNRAHIIVRGPTFGSLKSIEHSIKLAQTIKFESTIPDRIPFSSDSRSGFKRVFRRIDHLLHHSFLREKSKVDIELQKYEILRYWLMIIDGYHPSLINPMKLSAYYLPADRTGIMHAHSLLVKALIASASAAGILSSEGTSTLSGVMADFLQQLLSITQDNKRSLRKNLDYSEALENQILRGSINVTQTPLINYPRFIYRPQGWNEDLELANASSMVSELAPVVLYLRHLVEPNNVLIVEEPESHLHPAMQVELVRQLATLVDKGIRVIVTTHSEWLVDELANIVRRSKLPVAKRDYKATLQPKQVGVWLFEPKLRPKGSIVKEIQLNECGLYPTQFEDVVTTLHNDWADITGYVINQ